MSDTLIQKRYAKETESAGLGCANLNPFLDIRAGEKVLDLGCGSGGQSILLAEKVGTAGSVTGIDLTTEMIDKAKAKNPPENVVFLTADMHSLPFSDRSYDLILSNCVINHTLRKADVFSEIFRVLKPGGRFLIGDVMSVEALPEEIANDPVALADCWGGAIPKEKYLEIVEQCGFIKLEILSSRRYMKNGYELESITLKGVRP